VKVIFLTISRAALSWQYQASKTKEPQEKNPAALFDFKAAIP
jgi:hypothetical protein